MLKRRHTSVQPAEPAADNATVLHREACADADVSSVTTGQGGIPVHEVVHMVPAGSSAG